MGCTFCATGQMGFSRQLSSAEIFEQAAQFALELSVRAAGRLGGVRHTQRDRLHKHLLSTSDLEIKPYKHNRKNNKGEQGRCIFKVGPT